MPSIESSGLPLCYKVRDGSVPAVSKSINDLTLCVYARALEGMQKEAVVASNFGSAWRMVSDEGPYLNGTDLAPFPLAFFTAGTQFSFFAEILRHAKEFGIELREVKLQQDNYYSMEGSALKGTMIGDAMSPEIKLEINSDASEADIKKMVELAIQSCPAHALMRESIANVFSINFNGGNIPVARVNPSPHQSGGNPDSVMDKAEPVNEEDYLPGIIKKLSSAEVVAGVAGGAGSSLQATQKRTLHVRGNARVKSGSLLETDIHLLSPIGSNFYFIADCADAARGGGQAPPPLAYVAAGVAFCYMTQIGRYAHITKQKLHSYAITQQNSFVIDGRNSGGTALAKALPADTQVFLEVDETPEVAQQAVWMGEQTCFLHAAMRAPRPSRVEVTLNGNTIRG